MQQRIGYPGAQRPEKKTSRPVLLEIKNLTGEENPRAQRDRTDGMECSGKNREAFRRKRSCDVKKRNQQQDKPETLSRRQRVPVCRDKQQHTRAQQQSA